MDDSPIVRLLTDQHPAQLEAMAENLREQIRQAEWQIKWLEEALALKAAKKAGKKPAAGNSEWDRFEALTRLCVTTPKA